MVRIELLKTLYEEIDKKFKKEAIQVYELIESLQENPKKGKLLGTVGGIVVKELKYKKFRFYFLADGYKLKVFSAQELADELIRFVRMSDKKHQQETIEEIKNILRTLGPKGF